MLKIDFQNILDGRLFGGLSTSDFNKLQSDFIKIKDRYKGESIGFKALPFEYENLKQSFDLVSQMSATFEYIVVIGIGGSDLGTRAIVEALKNKVTKKILFGGDTTDPDAISELLAQIDLKSTLFLVVSKSGNTIEQGSLFVYLRDLVSTQLGKTEVTKHFVFLTDPVQGTLKALSRREGYQTIDIPSEVGGRFSVLSSVGMIPAHLAGLDVKAFLDGAKEAHDNYDLAFQYALALFCFYKNDKHIDVLMPYKSSLEGFAKWYRQLFAESLGKKLNMQGIDVFEGITPVAALGPVDQHSQLQLYNEGPNNKVITFIYVEKPIKDIALPANFESLEEYKFLKGRSFNELLKLELETTAYALTKNKRPNMTISIPELNEFYLGQLFYFFQITVTYLGFMMNVDPFNQPGVELSKNAMYGVLGKEGFEQYKKDLELFNL